MPKPHRPAADAESRAAWLFLLPSLAGVFLFLLLPFAETLRRSFCDTLGKQFLGLANYRSVLTTDAFLLAVQNTARFIGVCLPLLLVLSLVLALALHAKPLRGTPPGRLFKTSFLLPMAIPVASLVLLGQVLVSDGGLFNAFLTGLGAAPVRFMATGAAFWVLIATYLWKNCGYDSILWISGLDAIPEDLYEAAAVDGAGTVRSFFSITLPNLTPTLLLTAILSLLNTFKVFREAYLVAGAYPHKSIYLLQHLFNNWFLDLDLPRLTAAAVLIALALLGLILLLLRLWGKSDTD